MTRGGSPCSPQEAGTSWSEQFQDGRDWKLLALDEEAVWLWDLVCWGRGMRAAHPPRGRGGTSYWVLTWPHTTPCPMSSPPIPVLDVQTPCLHCGGSTHLKLGVPWKTP